jgi:hypothetical protein
MKTLQIDQVEWEYVTEPGALGVTKAYWRIYVNPYHLPVDCTTFKIEGKTKTRTFQCMPPMDHTGEVSKPIRLVISHDMITACHGFDVNFTTIKDDSAVAIIFKVPNVTAPVSK